MKRIYLTALVSSALSGLAFAQAPTTPPAPATPPATATTTSTTSSTTTTPPTGEKKVKPFSQSDIKTVQVFAEALLFHMKMGDVVKYRKDKDAGLSEMGTKLNKEAKDLWTPMVNLAQTHQVDGKNIPTEITKNDKANIDKLGKVKDDKYAVEFLELFAKEAKHNAKATENAAKGANDPELKTWAEGAAKVIAAQADQLETAHKDAKKKK